MGGGTFYNSISGLPLAGRAVASLMALSPGVVALGSGQLGGVVIDPSGAAVPGARIEVENTATHATRFATADSEGRWIVSGLGSGSYRVSVAANAFQTTNTVISYDAENPRAYQTALALGSAMETVEVQTSTTAIDTDQAQVGRKDRHAKKAPAPTPPPPPSANVYNLQQRVAGVLPVAVDIPRAGASYRFLRPLVLNEETRLSFAYKSK